MIAREVKKFLFNFYLSIPGSKHVFWLMKKIYVPPYRWRKYLRFRGVFTVDMGNDVLIRLKNHGNTIENELFWLGAKGWENCATDAWQRLSKQSAVILDVGANTGLYSLISAKVNPSAEIYAFEPVDRVFKRFEKNIKLNNLIVKTFPIALADEDGEGKIFMADTISNTFDQASMNSTKYTGKSNRYVTIKMTRLSSFIEQNGLTNIDLIKIDVETFEPQVLAGLGPYLKTFMPTMLIEILNENVGLEVEKLIDGLNYQYFLIDEKQGYIPKSRLIPNKRGNNFILLNTNKHKDFHFPGFTVN